MACRFACRSSPRGVFNLSLTTGWLLALALAFSPSSTEAASEHVSLTTFSIEQVLTLSTEKESTHSLQALLAERNIVFVPSSTSKSSQNPSSTTESVSGTTSPPSSSSSSLASASQTGTTLSNSSSTASSNSSTVYRLDIPATTGSNNLKYLYLVFLLLGVIIIALIARVVILKRRRAKKLEKQAYNRNEALRLDLENRASDENLSEVRANSHENRAAGEVSANGTSPPSAPSRTPYTFPLFSMSLFRNPVHPNGAQRSAPEMQEVASPPPPYPTHVKPAALFRDSRLPVYQEVSEDEEEDRGSRSSDAQSQRQLTSGAGSSLASTDHTPAHSVQEPESPTQDAPHQHSRRSTGNEEGFVFVDSTSMP